MSLRYLQRARRTLGPGRALTILEYHSVHPTPQPYSITPEALERHLDVIQSRYEVVRLRDVPALLRGGDRRHRIVITFDDAYLDFADYAFPILTRRGLPATVFVPTGYIGGFNAWDQNAGDVPLRYLMDADELRAVQASGLVDIGSHTIDHVRMATLDEGEMRRQAEGSRAALERLLSVSVRTFGYPYGMLDDYSRQTERVLAEAGYHVAVTSHWGTLNASSRLLALRRIALGQNDDEATLIAKIEGAYDWIAVKERVGRVMRTARSLTGRTQ
ncbi:MAG: polysaccharide deacetylase family protein [Gemmatimonadaceae bacterium]